jgi:hypothetical protein
MISFGKQVYNEVRWNEMSQGRRMTCQNAMSCSNPAHEHCRKHNCWFSCPHPSAPEYDDSDSDADGTSAARPSCTWRHPDLETRSPYHAGANYTLCVVVVVASPDPARAGSLAAAASAATDATPAAVPCARTVTFDTSTIGPCLSSVLAAWWRGGGAMLAVQFAVRLFTEVSRL